jgi:Flp pilus assembly protein TadG
MFKGLFASFSRDRRGNIFMLYALSLPVVVLAIGFAIDFGRAAQLRTKLNSAADAAALAALTPAMMAQSNAVAQAAAVAFFNGQAAGAAGLAAGQTSVTVTITNPNNNLLDRQVSVCWNAAEATIFAGILGSSMLPMGNCSSAQAEIPPNIDFYLLLDNSPSMQLPATQAGITQMQNLTPDEGSCAFACHQASTNNGDTAGNPCALTVNGTTTYSTPTNSNGYYCASSQGTQIDNFALARKNNITLRLDELTNAVTTLMSTAQTTSNSTPYNPPPTYRFSINAMDSSWQIGFNNIMPLTADYINGWSTASSNFQVMEYYSNDVGCGNAACTTSNSSVNDFATNYDDALSKANAAMPNPGMGTSAAGDTPQEVLFFVTDGVEDEMNGSRIIQPINYGTSTNYCSQIKARGIKIAILYTEYYPVPANGFYVSRVEPYQSQIAPALQACASPGLFYDAAVGSDLSQALSSLFQAVVQSANLTQ